MSAAGTPEKSPDRTLRRDARRNREKLLAAAAAVFAERGLDAPLEEIARQAGVSIGTLYNRFPTRSALIDVIFPEKIAAQLIAGDNALTCPDPWEGFVRYVETMCQAQAGDRGLNDALSMRFPEAVNLEEMCARGFEQAARIIERAQRHGSLRADFTHADLAFITWSNARIVEATGAVAPNSWRRHLSFLLDGLRADRAHPVDEPPLTSEQVYEAMRALATGGTGGSGNGRTRSDGAG